MASSKTQPARGMRDFLPADVRRREYVIGVIKDVYERYGFEPLETPAVENIETLMGKYGEEGNQLIFKILKRGVHEATGEADLALRYDLTVPLARVVAEYRDKLPKFFKRYQIQPVWRADRPARGRFREFYQCDVDVLGSRSMVVEAELIAAVSDVLTSLGFDDFIIRLNNRQILTAILDASDIPPQIHNATLTALDKYEKIGPGGIAKGLSSAGVSYDSGRRLLDLLLDSTTRSKEVLINSRATALKQIDEAETVQQIEAIDPRLRINDAHELILERIAGYTFPSREAEKAIRDTKELFRLINDSPASGRVVFDLTLARGISYYTGAIMEVFVDEGVGSLGGGGRYDNLVGMFSGQDVPACGFSLGLERIIVVMTERGMFPPQLVSSPADVMVSIWNEESVADSVALAQELRSGGSGLRVDLYPEADKLGKQFKYAAAREIPFVAVVGDDERARGEVAIKDMRSGEQRSVKRADVAETIRAGLN